MDEKNEETNNPEYETRTTFHDVRAIGRGVGGIVNDAHVLEAEEWMKDITFTTKPIYTEENMGNIITDILVYPFGKEKGIGSEVSVPGVLVYWVGWVGC